MVILVISLVIIYDAYYYDLIRYELQIVSAREQLMPNGHPRNYRKYFTVP